MLNPERAERILTIFKSLDVATKLQAITEAREMYKTTFSDDMPDKDWAYAAMKLEQFYNLTRELLGVTQIRIRKDTDGEVKAETKPKKPKPQAPQLDMAGMMLKFMEFQQKNKETGK
jgi:hypothetical protein